MLVPFVPNHVYLDTSIIIATMLPGLPNALASETFCTQLVRHGSHIYFSQILRLELSQAIRNLASRRGQLPLAIQREYQLDQWESNVAVRHHWMGAGKQKFDAFLASFSEAIELPFETEIWERSVEIIARNQLKSLDAVHIATARAYGLRHVATLDDDFNRIADLRVWLIRDDDNRVEPYS